MWPNIIRPAVIEELGEENSNNPNWLVTMKKIEMQMWGQLTDRQRAWYTEKALEINTGKLALEAKAEWVYFPPGICLFNLMTHERE